MEGPGGELGAAVERIMAKIRVHLKEDDGGSAVHYNRTYEAVTFELQRFQVNVTARNAELRGGR
jgi:hypothetical protein